MPPKDDTEFAFCEAFFNDPPCGLLIPAGAGDVKANLAFHEIRWRDCRIWESYFDASSLLLGQMLEHAPRYRNLIFPALFNLRHAIEVGLKWHIEYAKGTVPQKAGHNLELLVETFRSTASGLDEEVTYICEDMLDCALELAAIDRRSTAFRYSSEADGSSILLPTEPWDLRLLLGKVELLSLWFDHLKGYIDMSTPEYQAMLREMDAGQSPR